MKVSSKISLGTVQREIIYEEDGYVPWLIDVLAVDYKSSYVPVETQIPPLVAVGRAFTHHLKQCGLLDAYDPDSLAQTIYSCNIDMLIERENLAFTINLQLIYGLRNPNNDGSFFGLNETRLSEYLLALVVENKREDHFLAMMVNHYLVLQRVCCDVNGLEAVL